MRRNTGRQELPCERKNGVLSFQISKDGKYSLLPADNP